jgi:hypothetical protein
MIVYPGEFARIGRLIVKFLKLYAFYLIISSLILIMMALPPNMPQVIVGVLLCGYGTHLSRTERKVYHYEDKARFVYELKIILGGNYRLTYESAWELDFRPLSLWHILNEPITVDLYDDHATITATITWLNIIRRSMDYAGLLTTMD